MVECWDVDLGLSFDGDHHQERPPDGPGHAVTWRPFWQVIIYSVLLGLADRFLVYALFEGTLLSLSGFVIHTLTVMAMASFAFRISRRGAWLTSIPGCTKGRVCSAGGNRRANTLRLAGVAWLVLRH